MIDFGYGIQLRPFNKQDLTMAFQWRNDSRIWRWTRQSDLINWEDHLKWFGSIENNPKIKMYMICDEEGSIGVCGLTSIDMIHRHAEFSLYIDPDKHRRGFATQSLKTLLAHGFENLGLKSIWGETFEDNPAQFLFKKIGMKEEGVRREFYFKQGLYWDAILFSMLDADYHEENAKW